MRKYKREKKQERIMEMEGKCKRCGDIRIEFLGISQGEVRCFNCRELLKRKKRSTKKGNQKNN